MIKLSVSADTRYLLTVNGHYICEGPCISDTITWKYETVTVPQEALVNGANEFCVRVMYMRRTDFGFFSGIRKDRPALWLEGTVRVSDTEVAFAADETWTCLTDYGTELVPSQNTHPAMPPVQVVRDPFDLRETPIKTCYRNNVSCFCFINFNTTIS